MFNIIINDNTNATGSMNAMRQYYLIMKTRVIQIGLNLKSKWPHLNSERYE